MGFKGSREKQGGNMQNRAKRRFTPLSFCASVDSARALCALYGPLAWWSQSQSQSQAQRSQQPPASQEKHHIQKAEFCLFLS